uniref:Uncharacterized protein n=1 Tax=Fagus sylvatica TaxID=28930 RepID=A0A2N9IQ70_FAGSY
MASSSSQNKPETINLNDTPSVMPEVWRPYLNTPSVMPEVWRPYFLSINGPVSVTDSVILNGETATAVAAALRSQVTILQRLLKESKKKVGEVKEENKRLKALVDSYADDLVIRSTEQSKTTNKLQKQYEKLLAEVKELTSRSIP